MLPLALVVGVSKRGACKVVRFITQTNNGVGGALSKKQYAIRKHYMA
jgi:hypothetical protein